MKARDFSVVIDSGAMCRLGNKIGHPLAIYGDPSPRPKFVLLLLL